MEAEAESRKALAELKDVALDKYREQNKYRTAAECAIYFNQCMQGESVCGAGFESCVINPGYYDKKTYKPESLFDNGISENIINHPMAKWRCKQ